jgi:hypothetical protein
VLQRHVFEVRRDAAMSLAERVLAVSFDKATFSIRAGVHCGLSAAESAEDLWSLGSPQRCLAWVAANRERSAELLLAYAMCPDTPEAAARGTGPLGSAGRGTAAGDWVALRLLGDLGVGVKWRERGVAADAPEKWGDTGTFVPVFPACSPTS